jgi:hypothetical protein
MNNLYFVINNNNQCVSSHVLESDAKTAAKDYLRKNPLSVVNIARTKFKLHTAMPVVVEEYYE